MPNSNINLSMTITQDFDTSVTSYETEAKFIKKNDLWYLFFDEVNYDDHETTQCRFEISLNSVRMRRNGPIILEQMHELDKDTEGYIKTPFGHVTTRLVTTKYNFLEIDSNNYELNLRYHLYTGDELTGTYTLVINITTGGNNIS